MAHLTAFVSLIAALTGLSSCSIPDWLVTDIKSPTQLIKLDVNTLRLTNGIIARDFIMRPDFATVDFYSFEKKSSLLRAVGPEAVISLDGIYYDVGGIIANIPRAYLNRTALKNEMKVNPNAFHFVSYKTGTPEAPFPYTPGRGSPTDIVWPPKGLRLDVTFQAPYWAPLYHKGINVTVHYEMYDGHPIMAKWITLETSAPNLVEMAVLSVEYLAVNWAWADAGYKWLHVQSNQAHGTEITWSTDSSQPKMPGSFEQVVNCTYQITPNFKLGETFQSFKVFEVVAGTSDPERRGLCKRKLLRLLAPQTQENPIFFHMIHKDSKSVRAVLDQMAEVGFEMMIYSFGSGFDIESVNETYLESVAADVSYANSKGIEVGGYDLIALTRTPPKREWRAVGGHGACFASDWYDYLTERVLNFINRTGLSMVETDGPYGGYTCSSTNHSHHQGYGDSVYMQNKLQGEFFKLLRERRVYINQPDNYFYQGGSKTGMGYNEQQYSLPRWEDISVSRQGMFDDTFHYIPSIGWMFVPLVDYHGGGAAAAFEPLTNHSTEYEWALAQYMGAGVAACYRGHRLYDSPVTKTLVTKWVSFYKKYRAILNSDLIHVRRADMQGIDCFMHVNYKLKNKALAMVFNPTLNTVQETLTLPLYYTGLTSTAVVSEQGLNPRKMLLDRMFQVDVKIALKPRGITWFIIQ